MATFWTSGDFGIEPSVFVFTPSFAEGDDGYLSIAKTGGLGLKEKRDLTSLVRAENDDRKALYHEVAKALKIDESQTSKVAEIFAKEWQK